MRWLIFVFALGAIGCSRSPRGAATSRPRIVSLSPAMTETLYALGAGGDVVGVSRYCDFPSQINTLPRVGGFLDPSLETILSLRPTLVVGHRSPANRGVVDALSAAGVATYFPLGERVADLDATFAEVGRLASTQERGRALAASIRAELEAVARATRPFAPARVLLLYGLRPLTGAGDETFAGDMLSVVNATNVLAGAAPYSTLSDEQLLVLRPDVIIVSDMGEGDLSVLDATRFATVPAVRNGRVIELDDVRLMRPGPRLAEGARLLASAIHPQVRFE